MCVYLCCHLLQLDEAPPESVGVGTEAGEAGDHKAATTSGYSNIEAIEMTAAGTTTLMSQCLHIVAEIQVS